MGTAKQVILVFYMHERNFLNCFYFFTVSKLFAYSKNLSELVLYITFFCMCVDVHLCVGARVFIYVEARSCLHLTYIGAQSHTWFCQFTFSGSPACCGAPPPIYWEYRQVPKLVWHLQECYGARLLAFTGMLWSPSPGLLHAQQGLYFHWAITQLKISFWKAKLIKLFF